ncbi:hypothetical protein [Methylobacterium sp. sgz302541]|uniref:hypothetical protein n=1 Tax=unclassified Methylobacterium TaxID=2615210 RepID=UPI003D338A4A
MPHPHPAPADAWLALWGTLWFDLPLDRADGHRPGGGAWEAALAESGDEPGGTDPDHPDALLDLIEDLQVGCFA